LAGPGAEYDWNQGQLTLTAGEELGAVQALCANPVLADNIAELRCGVIADVYRAKKGRQPSEE